MKIIQIGSYPIDSHKMQGGVEASVYGISSELSKNNEVVVLDFPRYELQQDCIEESDNLVVYRFIRRKNNFMAVLRLKSILSVIKKNKPDVCHLHTTGFYYLCLYIILKIKSIPTVVTVHGIACVEKRNLWIKKKNVKNLVKYIFYGFSELFFISICNQIIVDTEYVNKELNIILKKWKIFRSPCSTVIPQGIDNAFFEVKTNPQKNLLLAVGSLSSRKGHLLLIDVVEQVKKQIPNIFLYIYGALSDNTYYSFMQEKIKEKGLNENIKIIPNASFNDVLFAYAQSELFVLHSEEESQGIVFCEAMATGKPVVATSVGGIPWVITHKENGFLCEYGDVNTFANYICLLLKDDNLVKKMGAKNKMKAEKYRWYKIADQVTNLYNALI